LKQEKLGNQSFSHILKNFSLFRIGRFRKPEDLSQVQ
jgi:hypothetical protein